jgi:hypothetical protein
MPEQPEQEPVEFPDTESLSYDERDVQLSRMPIDWELTDIKALEAMTQQERDLMILEQNRRMFYAIRDLAKAVGKAVPPEDGEDPSDSVNRALNPDQYPIYTEHPEVGPPEDLSGQ